MNELQLEHSAELSGIATALVKVQQELKSIKKDSSGYGYKYAAIHEIMDYALPILAKNGIAVTQFGDGSNAIVTMLIDSKTGQYIKGRILLPNVSELDMKGVNIAQKSGSLRTYFKRYAISEMIGLTSNDEDNDASPNGFDKPQAKPAFKAPAKTESVQAPAASESSTSSFRRPASKGSDL